MPLFFLKPLNRISEHGSGHGSAVLIEKTPERLQVFLPYLAQSPAACLVDQVFFVAEQDLGKVQSVFQMALADEPERRDYGNSSVPYAWRSSQIVKRLLVPSEKVPSHDVRSTVINSIPAVDRAAMSKIEFEDSFLLGFCAFLVLPAQDGVSQ